MGEDWNGFAAEVEAALRSIGDVSKPNSHPATIRKAGVGAPTNPWYPPGGTPTYHQVVVLIADKELRDVNGTLIGMTKRTLTISGAAGVVPSDDNEIILGEALTYVDDDADAAVEWQEVISVRPLAPAGVTVLYAIDLAS